ncbi:hypothetical protein LXL04_025195 [Taraxacum kok-saghyz]
MKKKACDSSSNSDKDDLKQKERHIVSWSEEEDNILREQIGIHGTNKYDFFLRFQIFLKCFKTNNDFSFTFSWAVIASMFENKTTRQCRRRWFTYLNSDFKKGGWSHEEDMLLCEAQKIFGNRWTEIAKVVSGRTDNAVKNRFSVLSKRKRKCDDSSSSKENNGGDNCMNSNNKRTRENTKMNKRIEKRKMSEDDICDGRKYPLPNSEFNSPIQVTPLFRSMAEGIPSPQFSESVRKELLAKNTWNGIDNSESDFQNLTISTLQKSPTPLPIKENLV